MKAHPKLLFVVTEDWYFVTHRLPLAVAAKKAGFDVAVATRVGGHEKSIRLADVRLIPFELSRRHGNPLLELFRLARLYAHEQPTIVHHVALKPIVYGTVAAWLARVHAQVNAVAGLGWLFTSAEGLMRLIRPMIQATLVWLLNRRGSLTIVQNPDDQALLIDAGLARNRVRLIRGVGVDTAIFHPAQEPPSGTICILLATRMLWDKGVGEFVEAARILTQAGVCARFVLLGDPDRGNPASVPLEMLQAWHGHNGVEWWKRREDMSSVFHEAHIACLPSYYKEGLPKVLLEAAASGLPIVTTDAPGCREVVRDRHNGFLVPPHDVSALVSALDTLIHDPLLRARMGQRGREMVVNEFSQERVIAETLNVYRELIP